MLILLRIITSSATKTPVKSTATVNSIVVFRRLLVFILATCIYYPPLHNGQVTFIFSTAFGLGQEPGVGVAVGCLGGVAVGCCGGVDVGRNGNVGVGFGGVVGVGRGGVVGVGCGDLVGEGVSSLRRPVQPHLMPISPASHEGCGFINGLGTSFTQYLRQS